ncbi:autophagy protein 5 [Tulasnella sp. 403]|nr:autophagy protein 5 [Tulasnella sp. 403]
MSYPTTPMLRGGAPSQTPAATSLFRRLVWEGTVPLEIKIDGKELPAGSDRGLECYYIQAPRISYLPLLIPDIKKHLTDLILDEPNAASMKEEEWWFEETERGSLMKWHWPLGLLYDYNTISQGLHSTIPPIPGMPGPTQPLRLTLHLTSPPTDKLLITPTAESCKLGYMGQLKEADFLRWGNTKRVTGLRKQDHDGLWESVRSHNFDDFWRIASKIFPTTTPLSSHSSANPNGMNTMNSPPSALVPPVPGNNSSISPPRPPSTDPSGAPVSDRDGAYTVRSVPVRIFLPDGPVLQELVPPVIEEGRPHTLRHFLRTHLPLLFPPLPSQPQAFALIQGVVAPGDAEMAWLGACLAGADGWVNVCIGLGRPPR